MRRPAQAARQRGPAAARVRPLQAQQRLCRACFGKIDKRPGGAEIELSLLFADVRGSTGLAERMQPHEFSQLISRFYGTAARVVDAWDGMVDKFVGDEVVALFVPGFTGDEQANRAIEAAPQLPATRAAADGEPWIPVGAGVHTGVVSSAQWAKATHATSPRWATPSTQPPVSRRPQAPARSWSALTQRKRPALETAGLEGRTLELRGREDTLTR